MKIYIIGSTGFFGNSFVKFFQKKNWEILTERTNILDLSAIQNFLQKNSPDVVLNCAGKTGTPNVDWCESNKAETTAVNICGATNLAIACAQKNIFFAHVGSGCIFAGDNNGKGFTEEDEPNFGGSFYSRTKAISEKILSEFDALQFRVRIPICAHSHPKNVINKLLKYEKVASIENSFTIVEDFLPAAYDLIKNKTKGIFNMTNEGSMDHKFLMENYKKIVDPSKNFSYIEEQDLQKIVIAPRSNCVLNTDKQKKFNIHMPNIKERIPEILTSYKNNL